MLGAIFEQFVEASPVTVELSGYSLRIVDSEQSIAVLDPLKRENGLFRV